MSQASASPSPPYVSASLFRSTVEAFSESTTPNALDRQVLSRLSGGDYSSLISCMRFLDLVRGDDDTVQKTYRDLVAARKQGESEYKTVMRSIMEVAYEPIAKGLDLQHGTLSQVEKAFKDAGVSTGQMLLKTVRFYVKTLVDCGVTISPHITKPRRRSGAPKKANSSQPRTKKKSGSGEEPPTPTQDEQGAAMKVIELSGAGGKLTLSGTFNTFELEGDERELVFSIIDAMKKFESNREEDE